jgi:hypothetical protein
VAGGWFKLMSIVDELESAFKSQASFSDTSELLFTHRVALEIIENCAKKGILILGMDFYVRDGHDYKQLLSSLTSQSLQDNLMPYIKQSGVPKSSSQTVCQRMLIA